MSKSSSTRMVKSSSFTSSAIMAKKPIFAAPKTIYDRAYEMYLELRQKRITADPGVLIQEVNAKVDGDILHNLWTSLNLPVEGLSLFAHVGAFDVPRSFWIHRPVHAAKNLHGDYFEDLRQLSVWEECNEIANQNGAVDADDGQAAGKTPAERELSFDDDGDLTTSSDESTTSSNAGDKGTTTGAGGTTGISSKINTTVNKSVRAQRLLNKAEQVAAANRRPSVASAAAIALIAKRAAKNAKALEQALSAGNAGDGGAEEEQGGAVLDQRRHSSVSSSAVPPVRASMKPPGASLSSATANKIKAKISWQRAGVRVMTQNSLARIEAPQNAFAIEEKAAGKGNKTDDEEQQPELAQPSDNRQLVVVQQFSASSTSAAGRKFYSMFSSCQRVRLAYDALLRGVNLSYLEDEEFVIAHFALDNPERNRLRNFCLGKWGRYCQQMQSGSKWQFQTLKECFQSFVADLSFKVPVEEIHDYYGPSLAFYFAFVAFFARGLIPIATLGVLIVVLSFARSWTISRNAEDQTPGSATTLTDTSTAASASTTWAPGEVQGDQYPYMGGQQPHQTNTENLWEIPAVAFGIYSCFTSLWTSVFLANWRRSEAFLRIRWYGLPNGNEKQLGYVEPLRPRFKGMSIRSPVTGEPGALHFPSSVRVFRQVLSWIILSSMLGVSIWLVIMIGKLRTTLVEKATPDAAATVKLIQIMTGWLNTIQINVFNALGDYTARSLNEWENYPSRRRFCNSLIIKLFIFRFINNFNVFFYIAFAKTHIEGCVENGAVTYDGRACVEELQFNYALIFMIQAVSNVWELYGAVVSAKLSKTFSGGSASAASSGDEPTASRASARDNHSSPHNSDTSNRPLDNIAGYTSDEQQEEERGERTLASDHRALVATNQSKIFKPTNKKKCYWRSLRTVLQDFLDKPSYGDHELDGTFEDWVEIVVLFGDVTLFSVIFPLAPLLAMILALVEIRIDSFKIFKYHRRPTPRRCVGIGSWLYLLELVSWFSLVTNAALLVWTFNVIPTDDHWVAFCFLVLGLGMLKYALEFFIPVIPTNMKTIVARHRLLLDRVAHKCGAGMFGEKSKEENSSVGTSSSSPAVDRNAEDKPRQRDKSSHRSIHRFPEKPHEAPINANDPDEFVHLAHFGYDPHDLLEA
ncbi:unnamed protein product [Amoebophrya sp. A25]|nr:unnamed protein product [Amoebophrya sp. A25]|eukprot:GSA25T00017872001.1